MVALPRAAPVVYGPWSEPTRLRIAEAPPLSEADLARIWAAQSFPAAALSLVDGRRLRVIQPGRSGGSAGPDFRDAVIEIEGRQQRGDIELHLRASFFRQHGHQRDAAYNGVILHVVFDADDGSETRLQDGALAPVAAFAPWLAQRQAELRGWLAAAPLWREPCQDAVERLGTAAVAGVLEREGEARFRLKTARLAEAVAAAGAEEALWRALLDGLGYGGDRPAWRRLAVALPASSLRRLAATGGQTAIETALLATAGLTVAPAGLAEHLPPPLSPALSGGSRPANRPERRLTALARLWQRAGGELAAFALESVRAALRLQDLVARWQVAAPGGGAALLGGQRTGELLLNAVLPFAAAVEPELAAPALRLAAQLPAAPAYGKTQFLEANLRSEAKRRSVRSALQQQGLLALHAAWCSQGGCGRCPLS